MWRAARTELDCLCSLSILQHSKGARGATIKELSIAAAEAGQEVLIE